MRCTQARGPNRKFWLRSIGSESFIGSMATFAVRFAPCVRVLSKQIHNDSQHNSKSGFRDRSSLGDQSEKSHTCSFSIIFTSACHPANTAKIIRTPHVRSRPIPTTPRGTSNCHLFSALFCSASSSLSVGACPISAGLRPGGPRLGMCHVLAARSYPHISRNLRSSVEN